MKPVAWYDPGCDEVVHAFSFEEEIERCVALYTADQVAALTKERDDLKVSAEYWASHAPTDAYVDQLAASQAREAKLREALEDIKFCTAPEPDDGSHHENAYWIATESIALPTDDSALQQRLAEERELCAKACEQGLCNRPSDPPANYFDGGLRHCAVAIRSMK